MCDARVACHQKCVFPWLHLILSVALASKGVPFMVEGAFFLKNGTMALL